MLTWGEFQQVRPDLAESGRGLFYQFGVGLAFLAMVAKEGGPRLHPIAPQLAGQGLYGFLVPSPKLNDLIRDGRYSLHSYPKPENEDAFYATGRAWVVEDLSRIEEVRAAFVAEPERKWEGPPPDFLGQTLIEFLLDTCLLTRTTGRGDPAPLHTIWHAG